MNTNSEYYNENQTQNIFDINYIIKILVEYLYSNLDAI